MNKLLRCIGICLGAVFAFGAAACGEGGDPPEKKLQPAPERAWADITTYGEAAAEAYLQPFWYTREIYDESVVMVGETASASLLYLPSGSVTVRDYQLGVTYVEGRDYTVEGKTITRVAGGRLPYFEPDEYFLVSPNVAGVSIGVNASRCEFEFDENRYLYYGEGTSLTKNHVVVSYRTDEMWPGERPAGQTDRTGKLIETLKTEKKGTILYYGDSITVGCNASGTSYGGNVNPYLPSWPELVASWLEKQYGAEIEVVNKAVGGWQVSDGFASYNASVAPDAANTDLLVLAFGMNDGDGGPLSLGKSGGDGLARLSHESQHAVHLGGQSEQVRGGAGSGRGRAGFGRRRAGQHPFHRVRDDGKAHARLAGEQHQSSQRLRRAGVRAGHPEDAGGK